MAASLYDQVPDMERSGPLKLTIQKREESLHPSGINPTGNLQVEQSEMTTYHETDNVENGKAPIREVTERKHEQRENRQEEEHGERNECQEDGKQSHETEQSQREGTHQNGKSGQSEGIQSSHNGHESGLDPGLNGSTDKSTLNNRMNEALLVTEEDLQLIHGPKETDLQLEMTHSSNAGLSQRWNTPENGTQKERQTNLEDSSKGEGIQMEASTLILAKPAEGRMENEIPPQTESAVAGHELRSEPRTDPNTAQNVEQNAEGGTERSTDVSDSQTPGTKIPGAAEENTNSDQGDGLFQKKDYRLRTQLFQSVLLSASLKSLKLQHLATPAPRSASASKNFQLFIQAPVLLAIRRTDEVPIGQQMPFEREAEPEPPVSTSPDDYGEQTTREQQRLTLNALRKLLLSLAPIAGLEGDRTRPLTTARRPYAPAQVDLSTFASLTRQSRHQERETGHNEQEKVDKEQERPKDNEGQEGERQGDEKRESQTQVSERQENGTQHAQDSDIGTGKNKDTSLDLGLVSPTSVMNVHGNLSMSGNTHPMVQTPALALTLSPTTVNETTNTLAGTNTGTIITANEAAMKKDEYFTHNNASFTGSANDAITVTGASGNGDTAPPTVADTADRSSSSFPHPAKDEPNHLQQIKHFRSPMYVPAVLRRTQGPEAPGSPESSASADLRVSDALALTHDYIARAPPTRRHWLKDDAVTECGMPNCRRHFTFFDRRHHCRKCGGIFCKDHTLHFLYINHLAQFTTGGRGTLSRVCDRCIDEYNDFIRQEFGPPARTAHSTEARETSLLRDVLAGRPVRDTRQDLVVGSVPANWSWSSF